MDLIPKRLETEKRKWKRSLRRREGLGLHRRKETTKKLRESQEMGFNSFIKKETRSAKKRWR